MEEAISTRLELLTRRLDTRYLETSAMIVKDIITEVEFTQGRLFLAQAITCLKNEIQLLTKTGQISVDTVRDCTEKEIQAEELLARLDALKISLKPEDRAMSVRLPKLELTKFKGDVTEWFNFWDRFKSSVHDRNLSDADKLTYLISALEGRALETIQGLGTTNENYQIAIDCLQQQFGNKNMLIDAHYESIRNIPRADHCADECRRTLNSVERHLRVLQALGEDINGNHLRGSILNMFPSEIVYEVNLLSDSTNSSISTIRENLERVIRSMERAHRASVPKTEPSESKLTSSTEALYVQTFKKGPARFSNPSHTSDQNRKRRREDNSEGYYQNKRFKKSCDFCRGDHYPEDCQAVSTIEDRRKKLRGKCYRCLKMGHMIRECRNPLLCVKCKGNHHVALCPKPHGKNISPTVDNKGTETLLINNFSYLQTATATIRNQNREVPCRNLLDSGSQRTYLTKESALKIKLTADQEDLLLIFTFGSETPKETTSPSAEILLTTKRGVQRKIRVNIIPHITDRVPIFDLPESLSVDVLADDHSIGQHVDLLIGNDLYFSFIRSDKIQIQGNLYLIDTDFGWIVSGSTELTSQNENMLSAVTYCQCHEPECSYLTRPDLPLREDDVKFLWSLENIGITDSPKSTRQDEAVKYFNDTVKYEDNRYHVKWPWTHYPPTLPTNYGLAYGRLKSLVQRLDQDSLQHYDVIIQEQLNGKIIEVVDPQPVKIYQVTPPIHYLPHHIIRQEGKQGRIVYDASAKVREQNSLNECLYRGPSMVEDLTGLLLKFRTNKVGITADVEKAFLQVGLQREDRDVTLFLWLKNPAAGMSDENLLHLRFTRVPFGIISSPFLLTATIRHHLLQTNDKTLMEIGERCYVDNLITGSPSTTEAINIYSQTRAAFSDISMNIRDWISNDQLFMQNIPEEHRAKNSDEVKVLGLVWNLQTDSLKLRLNKEIFNTDREVARNKKEVLRVIASFYDPCGFAAPLLLPAKLFLQRLWKENIKWHTPLPDEYKARWKLIVKDLHLAKKVELPRYVGDITSLDQYTELHCFADASKNAYAAVVYLRTRERRQIKTALMMSKARVTPLPDKHDLKIPKLELLGCLIGSRLLAYIKETLKLSSTKLYLWTDSLIVLGWLRSKKLLPPFVARRITAIKNNKEVLFKYVNTGLNPADLATRPELWDQKCDMWFQGPAFLLEQEQSWPKEPKHEEQAVYVAGEGLDDERQDVMEVEDITGLDFMDIDKPEYNSSDTSTVQQLLELQQQYFPKETAGEETHLTRNLGLYKDVDGILRSRGRMANTLWPYDMKHPILIPKDCEFTNRVIRETHETNYHIGASHTLSIIRRTYWIPQGRTQVQKVLKKCPQCSKYGGGLYRLPQTPNLPQERVTYSAPFTYTGMDYFGPIYVKGDNKDKRWICLYTCLAVRAIHMEVVKDLTADECLLALRRFIAVRGIPSAIVSDNALQFKLSAEVLSNPFCSSHKIKWKFIPQLAPWHGGFYERMVGLVKHCLKRTLEKQLVREDQLSTVIKEIESVVNTRPLTRVGPELEHVLKPSNFLSMGHCIIIEPEEQFFCQGGTATKQSLVEGWKKGQNMLNHFKKMFIDQYLLSLREKYNTTPKEPRVKSDREPKVGDIVQIKGESKNRGNWKVGKITSLVEGSDGACRVAKIKVGDTEFTRSIGHLYPLEMDSDESMSTSEAPAIEPSTLQDGTAEEITVPELTRDQVVSSEKTASPVYLPDIVVHTPNNETCIIQKTPEAPLTLDEDSQIVGNTSRIIGTEPDSLEVGRSRREAAIKAREKIAQMSRYLLTLLRL